MPNILPELLIGLLQCAFGIYAIWRKQFSIGFRMRWWFFITWGDRQYIFTITGFRAIIFGAVNLLEGIMILAALLAMRLLRNFPVAPIWLVTASLEIAIVCYVVVCFFELLDKRQHNFRKRKNEDRYQKIAVSLGDDGELIESANNLQTSDREHQTTPSDI